ncbi:MAG: sulfotransferase [Planctomycetes bacterium]|nr:sulfotransferase [Planctomycetota bacterium]
MQTPTKRHTVILVAGHARSGTTWLGKIFDSHPRTLYRHEPEHEVKMADVPAWVFDIQAAQYQGALCQYVRNLPEVRIWNVAGIPPVFRKEWESYGAYQQRRAMVYAARFIKRLYRKFEIRERTEAARAGEAPIVWKSITMLGRLNVVVRSTVGIRVVHLIRHPCGVLASRLRGGNLGKLRRLEDTVWIRQGTRELFESCEASLLEGLEVTAAEIIGLPIEDVFVLRWALLNAKAMNDIEAIPGCMTVRYEDLCADPVGMTRRLFDATGLTWHRQTEEFLRKSISKHSRWYYGVFKDPKRGAFGWREELSVGLQERVEVLVGRSLPGRLYYNPAALRPNDCTER